MQESVERAQAPGNVHGEQIIEQLRKGELPQMVDWFDPLLLVKMALRVIVSTTMGQYADQRLTQAATDRIGEKELPFRYDYSKPNPNDETPLHSKGALWVDYVADVGDGFEATYAMAYLLASESLLVHGVKAKDRTEHLPAGELLVMGGDQAYPESSIQEYQDRLLNPYNWAFTTDEPKRKLFAIPGNHDWYDGLGAFDNLFCSARDRISKGKGKQIGGWVCQQHRSYFAIKLPNDWWIWGPDIQLAGVLDDSQRDYFDLVSAETRKGDKIIVCLAEPSWLHENYDNLHEISMLARKNGATLCAVLAGDLHHYSRYYSKDLGIQFINCGGGGAYANASHALPEKVTLEWPEITGDELTSGDDPKFDQMERGVVSPDDKVDFSLRQHEATTMGGAGAAPVQPKLAMPPKRRSRARALRKEEMVKGGPFDCECKDESIYPRRALSRTLSFKNFWLPLHSWRFTIFVGLFYFLYAWVFLITDRTLNPTLARNAAAVAGETAAARPAAPAGVARAGGALSSEERPLPDALRYRKIGSSEPQGWHTFQESAGAALHWLRAYNAAINNPAFFFMLLGLWGALVYYADVKPTAVGGMGALGKIAVGTLHYLAHVSALLLVCAIALSITMVSAYAEQAFDNSVWLANGPDWLRYALAEISHWFWFVPELTVVFTYTLVFIVLGGFLGALIFGAYWAIMAGVFGKHGGDAFSALGIKDYKHFLRIKFEPDRVTIYPIAIDKVPGRHGWKPAPPGEAPSHNPEIMPKRPLWPRLIEAPITIVAADVAELAQRKRPVSKPVWRRAWADWWKTRKAEKQAS